MSDQTDSTNGYKSVPGTKVARLLKSLALLVPGTILFLVLAASPAQAALVSHWKLDGNANNSQGINNGTVTRWI